MGLSGYIEDIIEKYHETIISSVPFQNILMRLRSAHILSSDQAKKLRQYINNEDAGFDFIEILKSKHDEKFFQFCQILKESQIENVQNVGQFLENAAIRKERFYGSSTNQRDPSKYPSNSQDYLLRDLPYTLQSDYVLREQFNIAICDQLKRIDQFGGHILVHGMPGSGKTVAVCQAIRQLTIQENYFKPYGCHWIKIGDISEQQLLVVLRSLATEIGVENTESIQSLVEINSKIKQYFQRIDEKSNILFVFDDIWNQNYYNYLTFAKKSIITSRFNHIRNKNMYYYIPATENLTDDEAIQVLQKRRSKDNNYNLTSNTLVKDAIHSCKGLPLAISVIGGLNLRSDEEWRDIIKTITMKDLPSQVLTHDYDFNLFATFQLSVYQLDEREQQLFRLLGVFKAVEIPLQSIISLWRPQRISEIMTATILKKLNQRSLLKFTDSYSPTCVVHDLIIEYLQQPIDHQQSIRQYSILLNKNLIDGYFKQCHGKWFRHPHDNYYYQYLIYHAVKSEDYGMIQDIMQDFKWMNAKLQSDNTIYNLCVDMENAIDCLRINKIENWQQYQQLVQLFKRYESTLLIKSMDLVQALLTLDYDIEWIRERALKLAKENNSDNSYWKIAMINDDKVKGTVEPSKSKRIGKTKCDHCIAVANPPNGNLRIIGTENNWAEDCRILIMDYETSKIVYQITPYQRHIRNLVFCPNSQIVAFQSTSDWNVYNVDNNQKLYFYENKLRIVKNLDFYELKFSPIIDNNGIVLATLSLDRKQVKVWKIDGNTIQYLNKKISINYKIASVKWIDHGSKIMLWWRKYGCNDYGKPLDRNNWINECQIQIWDTQSWQCVKSLQVPALIIQRENQYLPTININDSLPLESIHYINNSIECLVLSYASAGGLLLLENYHVKLWYDEQILEQNFHPFPSFINSNHGYLNIAVSAYQHFISITSGRRDVYVFKVANGQLQSYIKLKSSHLLFKSIFTPGNDRLLVYDETSSLLEYDMQESSLQWKILKNDGNTDVIPQPKSFVNVCATRILRTIFGTCYHDHQRRPFLDDGQIIDSSCAYISNNPVCVQLIEKGETEEYKLKVHRFEKQACSMQFEYTLEKPFNKCYIYDDLLSVIVIRTYWKGVIITQHKPYLTKRPLTVLAINLSDGQCEFYTDKDYTDWWDCIYMDEYYLIVLTTYLSTQKYAKASDCNTKSRQIATTQKYDISNEGIACKITLPMNQSIDDLPFKSSPLKMNKEKLIKYWGEKDGNAFSEVPEDNDRIELFKIEKGNHFVILNHDTKVWIKGNKGSFKSFNDEYSVVRKQNRWCNKFWIGFNKKTKIIEMYEVETMQLCQIVPFPYFNVWGIKWNHEETSFIVFDEDGRQNCVIERV